MLNWPKPYKDRQKEENAMTTVISRKPIFKSPIVKRASALALLFALIFLCIIIIRSLPQKDSEFVDTVAGDIEQEMAESRIVLDSRGLRHTAADFREPIILSHGKESRLIVHTVHLSETTSISDEGLWGMAWTSIYQDIVFEGDAQYTVDLSGLSEDDFTVNNELKTLTVRIPYAVLDPINIPADQIGFLDAKKGWAAPSDIKLSPEQNAELLMHVNDRMKAKLIDENIVAAANENAKIVVAELLTATVHSVDPEYTVIVVQ